MDKKKIIQTISALEKTFGGRVCIHDYTNRINPVLGSGYSIHTAPFCSGIKRSNEYRGMRCMADDMETVQARLEKTKKSFFKICHMNVIEAVCPVISREEVCGVLFFGPILVSEELPGDEVKRTIRLSRQSASDKLEYNKLQIFSPDEASDILILAEAVALQVSVLISRDTLKPKESLDRNELIDRFIYYRMRSNIGLEDLAEYLNVSESRMTQLLRELKGKSFPALLSEARITRAKRYLSHSRFSIGQVAENCGFNDQAYFHRVFKKAEGMTPGQYRKKYYRERQV